ncbi:MAG: TetR/AcrR family transcriptional regulator [Faecalibacillus sp.]
MPPKARIKKEDIIKVTFEIVRKEGMEAVNARRIAKEMNCSVQPIFSNFSNMEELKKEVLQKAYDKYYEYITSSNGIDETYKSIGINLIKLAKEEPKIFQILFMSPHEVPYNTFITSNESYNFIESTIEKRFSMKMSKEDIASFHAKMWFFTHGIASLVASQTCSFTDEEISELLTQEFIALSLLEKYKRDHQIDPIVKI